MQIREMEPHLRDMKPDDAFEVVRFWEENYKLTERELTERLIIYLDKNEGLSTVIEADGEIIAVCLGSYTGRKASIEMVAVHQDYRGLGYGRVVVLYTKNKLLELGALDIRVFCKPELADFYQSCGFELIEKDEYLQLQVKKYDRIDRSNNVVL